MTRTKAVLLVSFVLVFVAGLAAGRLTARRRPRHRGRSWLTSELNLTPDQRDQMQEIWSEATRQPRAPREDWAQARRERDEAVRELLSDEQTEEYDRIIREREERRQAMADRRRKAFEDAVARTKEILTPEQRAKYDEIRSRMPERGRRGPFGPGMRGPRRPEPEPAEADPADEQDGPR